LTNLVIGKQISSDFPDPYNVIIILVERTEAHPKIVKGLLPKIIINTLYKKYFLLISCVFFLIQKIFYTIYTDSQAILND
jgi:hypothetical protein